MAFSSVERRNEYSKNWMTKKRATQTEAQRLAHNAYMSEWVKKNPEKVRAYRLARKFGITSEQYDQCFQSQKGCCAICGKHQSELKKALHVDHCHKTGKNRSLLCHKCNLVIGLFEDNDAALERAAGYLRFHRARD